jgi:hypothetical protein
MKVTLDEDQWIVNDSTPLMQILAEISDRAYARNRVVISLQMGERYVTDRDLTSALLAANTVVGPIRATTHSMAQVIQGAEESMGRFGSLLKTDGHRLIQLIRAGQTPSLQLDAWMGRLADYLECREVQRSQVTDSCSESLNSWVSRLLEARIASDWVAVADVVEYEILTRLPG